jgi:hypothetical protein
MVALNTVKQIIAFAVKYWGCRKTVLPADELHEALMFVIE